MKELDGNSEGEVRISGERIVLSSKEVYFRAKLVKRVICMRV